MSNFQNYFLNLKGLFSFNDKYYHILKTFQERIKKMDARIEALEQEVNRAVEVQQKAVEKISNFVNQIGEITQQLVDKTKEGESTLADLATIEELVSKLKSTNDSLSAIVNTQS